MENDENEPPYAVGYGKPPRAHQFQPGKSGNPRGRPRKSRNMLTLLDEELDRLIIIKEGGRERKIPKREAIAKRFVASALQGDLRSIEALLKSSGSNPKPDPIEFDLDADVDFEAYLARETAARRRDSDDEQETNSES